MLRNKMKNLGLIVAMLMIVSVAYLMYALLFWKNAATDTECMQAAYHLETSILLVVGMSIGNFIMALERDK